MLHHVGRVEVLRSGTRQLADLLVTFASRSRSQHVTEPERAERHQFLHESSLWRMEETAALAAVAAAAPPITPADTLLRRRKLPLAIVAATASRARSHLLLRLKSLIRSCPSLLVVRLGEGLPGRAS